MNIPEEIQRLKREQKGKESSAFDEQEPTHLTHPTQSRNVSLSRLSTATPSTTTAVLVSSSLAPPETSGGIVEDAKRLLLSSGKAHSPHSPLSPYSAPFTRSFEVQLKRLHLVKDLLRIKEALFRHATNATSWIAYQVLLWLRDMQSEMTKQQQPMQHQINHLQNRSPHHCLWLQSSTQTELIKLSLAIAFHFNQNVNFDSLCTPKFRRSVIRIVLLLAEKRFLPIIPQLGIPDPAIENILIWCVFCFGGKNFEHHKREALFVWNCYREKRHLPDRIWASMMVALLRKCRNDYHLGIAIPSQELLSWFSSLAPVPPAMRGKDKEDRREARSEREKRGKSGNDESCKETA